MPSSSFTTFFRSAPLALALTLGVSAAVLPFAVSSALAAPASVNADEKGVILHGYDPVAYFTDGKPVLGSPEFKADYNGGTYHFASAKHRDLFTADPAKYAPQFGGYCAIGTSFNKKVDGNPTLWKIVDNKLYVNINEKAHELWLTGDTNQYISNAHGNWAKIKDKPAAEVNAQ